MVWGAPREGLAISTFLASPSQDLSHKSLQDAQMYSFPQPPWVPWGAGYSGGLFRSSNLGRLYCPFFQLPQAMLVIHVNTSFS